MGPGVCRDCQKLRVRLMDRERMEADFPRLRVSEKNVTTSAVVMRVLPDMTQAEIQDKIARGEIDRFGLLFPPRRFRVEYDDDDDDDRKDDGTTLRLNGLRGELEAESGTDNEDDNTAPDHKPRSMGGNSSAGSRGEGRAQNPMVLLTKLKLKLAGEASTPLFFMDLKHMNSKIFRGQVSKTLRPPPEKTEAEKEEEEGRLGVPVVPTFVSPRKSKLVEEPAYKVYFEPPLLAKHRQVRWIY